MNKKEVEFTPFNEAYSKLNPDCIYPNSIFIDNEPTRHELFETLIKLQQENKELHNKIDKLEDELEWYKQECDDLEMSGGVGE